MHLVSDVDGDLIVEPRRRAQTRCSIVGPENSNKTLLGRARARSVNAISAESFGFVVSRQIFGVIHRRRRRNAKLAGRLQDECRAFTPVCAQRERDQTDRVLTPIAGHLVREIIDAEMWLGNLRAIICAERENCCGSALAQRNAIRAFVLVADLREIVGQERVERRCLRRIKRDQCVVRRLRDGCIERDRRLYRLKPGVTSVAAKDGVDRIENRNVDNGHGATGATGPKLLAKGAQFARRHRCMIQSAGVNCDRVPAMNRVERIFWRQCGARRLHAVKARSKEITKAQRPGVITET